MWNPELTTAKLPQRQGMSLANLLARDVMSQAQIDLSVHFTNRSAAAAHVDG